jgi:hypothetical protein
MGAFWMQTAVLEPQITAVCIQTAEVKQGGGERIAQGDGEVAAGAFLVGEQGGAEGALVGAQGVDGWAMLAARWVYARWRLQQRRAVGTQRRARYPTTPAVGGQQQIQ